MEVALYALLTVIYGCVAVFTYKQGYTDGKKENGQNVPVLRRKSKPQEPTEEEKAAIERDRRINNFRG